jgi:acetyl esterase/lipase
MNCNYRVGMVSLVVTFACVVGVSPAQQPKVPDDVELLRNVEFGKGGKQALKLHILRPKQLPNEPMPVLVYINGSAWAADNKDMGIPRLILAAQHGYFCLTIQHRTSGEAVFPAQIEDCKCAVRFLRAKAKDYHLDTNHIGMWGGSSGGHLSALVATSADAKELEGNGGWQEFSSRVHAACVYFPAVDLLSADFPARHLAGPNGVAFKLLGGDPRKDKADLAKKMSPLTYITKDSPPFLIMHGDKDTTVPIEQGKLLYEALKKVGVEVAFETVNGKRHEELDPRNE